MTNRDKLKDVLQAVLGREVDETASAATIEAWDSLRHLQLILLLEDVFDMSFTEDEVVNMFDYSAIQKALENHGITF